MGFGRIVDMSTGTQGHELFDVILTLHSQKPVRIWV